MRKVGLTIAATVMCISLNAQNALDFDGSNDYVQTTKGPLTGNTPKTIEAWIKTTANCNPSAGGVQDVIVDMGATSTGARFTFNILWGNAIRLEVAGSGLSATTAVNDGNWHHVAGVYDPTATNKFKLYVDGVLDAQGNIATTVNTSSSGNIVIGKRIDNVNYFDGSIDEVRIWNVARSATQIANDRNAEFCALPIGLIAYYNFNNGNAGGNNSGVNNALDAVNKKNGTLNGFSLSGSSSNWVAGPNITGGLSVSNVNSTACDSIVSPSGTQVWTTSGLKVDTMLNANNCDSLIFVNATVNQSQYSIVNDTVCEPYLSPSGNYTYMTSGQYFDTTQTSKGCPHIHELNLDITVIDTTVNQNGSQLSSNQANAFHYIWLDCNDNFNQISGTNSQSYSPSQNGSYAVRVTLNQCIDTSECIEMNSVGVRQLNGTGEIVVFPNPVVEELTVEFNKNLGNLMLEVRSYDGMLIYSNEHRDANKVSIDVSEWKSGVYFLNVAGNEGRSTFKFIKR